MKRSYVHLPTASLLAFLSTAGLHAQQPSPSPGRAPLLLSLLDKDGDEKLSEDEARGGLKENFTIADINGDRGIDLDELTKLLEMAAARGNGVGAGIVPVPDGPSFGTMNEEQLARMRSLPPEQDREFFMVNLIKHRAKAKYADGRETDLTGEQADVLYSPIEFISEIGGNVAYIGRVSRQMGNSEPIWDRVAIVRYPSRAKFLEMVSNPEFQKRAIHKDAGVEVTQVLLTEREPWPSSDAKRVADEDDAFTLAQLVKYRDIAHYADGSEAEQKRTGEEAMDAFDAATDEILHEVGAAPVLKARVEGAVVGDGRTWDEFRLLHFPSRAAFLEAVEQSRDAMRHRNAAIDDIYLMQVETMRQEIKE